MSGSNCTLAKVRIVIGAMAAGLIASMPCAQAADLVVRYDQSQLLRLPRPVSEVIIGNPSIADVAVQGGNLLVVTGKSFGVTNIIALDADRNVIQDQRVVVDRDDQRMLAVYRGSARQTYSCAPTCSPAFVMGDDTKIFDAMSKAVQAKKSISTPARSSQQVE
jgi:Flp pilus assembly secretin CpaC